MVPRVAAVVPATLGIGMLAGRIRRVAEAATVNTNAWYVLTNRNNGKALEVSGASTAEAAGDSTADGSDDAQGMAPVTGAAANRPPPEPRPTRTPFAVSGIVRTISEAAAPSIRESRYQGSCRVR